MAFIVTGFNEYKSYGNCLNEHFIFHLAILKGVARMGKYFSVSIGAKTAVPDERLAQAAPYKETCLNQFIKRRRSNFELCRMCSCLLLLRVSALGGPTSSVSRRVTVLFGAIIDTIYIVSMAPFSIHEGPKLAVNLHYGFHFDLMRFIYT